MNRSIGPLLALAGALVFAGLVSCGKLRELPTDPGSGDPIDETATFTRIKNEIFSPTCAAIGCHGRVGAQQDLKLTSDLAYANTVGHPSVESPTISRVTPADPANSYLYRKIIGSGITGDRMPQGGPYLTTDQIKLVRDWIRRGAPND